MNAARPLLWVFVAGLLALAGCGGGRRAYDGSDPNAARSLNATPGRFYPPPGQAGDPWGPYVNAAASRFGVPGQWVRAVMRQESGGQQQAVSPVGAMGLMQLMPATYAGLRDRYGLGGDPFEPHDNIMAGTGYLREMYDAYGAPGMLAAYNAGPRRLEAYLKDGEPLPDETVHYVAAIAPNLGADTRLSGPLAVYGGGAVRYAAAPTPRSLAAGCDPDAAYDPTRPCRALEAAARAAVPLPTPVVEEAAAGNGGRWAVQVGAFADSDLARAMAIRALAQAPEALAAATVETPTVTLPTGSTLYRARLVGLTAASAGLACRHLNARQLPCIVVNPARA